jgi:hypothetical protein
LYKFVYMDLKPVKIFAAGNVPRLQYIADLILNEILGLPWEIVTDRRKLGKCPVINYSDINLPGSFRINPVPLLFETEVKLQEITVNTWRGLPVFFQSSADADLPFDIFAASFYLVTRYEEYMEFEPDEFGRFRSKDSVASKNGFLSIPVVDLWAKELAKSLVKKFQTLTFRRNEYKALLTFDIDEAYAYLGKNLIGNIGGFLHDITSRSINVSHRLGCLKGEEKDPYEVFDYMIESGEQYKTEIKFFFPVGDHSEFEKNPSWKNDKYRSLINKISDKFIIGLHPSFKASASLPLIKTELKRINAIVRKDCRLSRFHFLKISMPVSFRNLNYAGIIEDYSMGYPDECGFRAGIARPFRFYDVIDEKMTNLRIFPFHVMDVTLRGYKKLNVGDAKKIISSLILQTKKAGGLFISIWHNTSLLDTPECQAWREVFEFTLREQME